MTHPYAMYHPLLTQPSPSKSTSIAWPFFSSHSLFASLLFSLSITAWAEPGNLPHTISLSTAQIKSLGIETRLAQAVQGLQEGGFPGQITLPHDQMRLLSLPFAARVEQLFGAPGMTVKKGQWLFRLTVPQASELQRDQTQSIAANTLAQQALERDEQLYREGIIALSRLQTTRTAAAQAQALVTERQNTFQTAGLVDIGHGLFELRAPIEGVILEQAIQAGQRLEASEPLARIGRLNTFWLDFQVPATLAPSLRLGQKISLPANQASGRLTAIGRAVDASQSIPLRAQMDRGIQTLAVGQAVEVILSDLGQSERATDTVRLPATALVRQQGGHYVFIQEQQQFRAQAVTLVKQSGEDVLVRPIAPQTHIVTRGTSGLKAIWAGVGRE